MGACFLVPILCVYRWNHVTGIAMMRSQACQGGKGCLRAEPFICGFGFSRMLADGHAVGLRAGLLGLQNGFRSSSCRHGRGERLAPFASGHGSRCAVRHPRVLGKPVRGRLLAYKAAGRKAMLGVGKSHTRCSRETKVAVASVAVDGDAQARGRGKHDGVSLAVCFDSNVP